MGLIKSALSPAGGVPSDRWKEYFYCEAPPANTLAVRWRKRTGGRSGNAKGSDSIATVGPVVAIGEGGVK